MKEMSIKVKPCWRDTCFMTGEKADVNAVIRIDGSLTNKSLTELIDILTALHPPKEEPVQDRQTPVVNPDGDGDVPF